MPVWLVWTGVAALGAYVGSLTGTVQKILEPDPRNVQANSTNPATIIFYAGAALALAYGAKQVFNIK